MANEKFRASAVPLITNDPMLSVWSFASELTDDTTRHWSGARQFMIGVVCVDGIVYEFMGKLNPDSGRYFTGYQKLPQVSCEVRPMTTNYVFENAQIQLTLKFTSPLLLDDLMILSRPVSYISYALKALDGKEHDIHIYFGFSGEFCVNEGKQEVFACTDTLSIYFSSGTENMLKRSGDDHRIEWGSFHVIAPGHALGAMSLRWFQRKIQLEHGNLKQPVNYVDNQGPNRECAGPERLTQYEKIRVSECYPTLVTDEIFTLSEAGWKNHLTVCYDDVKAIQYFGENINDYWKKNGDDFNDLMRKAIAEYELILQKVDDAENELLKRAAALSPRYAQLLALAYRQVIAGHKLTWHDGELQFFSKENYSNGSIATVDITYPSMPLFLLYNPVLVEGMLNPIFKMVEKGLWPYEFAPHDAGTYPLANGQVYGFSFKYRKNTRDPLNKQMPVEECGNMILCVAALCYAEKDFSYFKKHFTILQQWADYLVNTGWNPENQLCTDDFAGHLAHNCNLSAKAICAIGAFGKLLRQTGEEDKAKKYEKTAREYAEAWEREGLDGDHYKLAFDQPGTWSIKYNMVWDKLLKLGLFSQKVYDRELAWYKSKMNPYGLPLDCRADYTKTDWEMWSTAMFEDKEYFNRIVDAMWDFLCETPDRVPFPDLPFTSKPVERGFQARTVQGGLFINLLDLC